jgi:tetratricopeptide (TPR) repeat protein
MLLIRCFGGFVVRKLTFEKAILIVFAAIIFISTTEIREKYTDIFTDRFLNKDRPVSAEVQQGNSPGFVSMLYKADNLYKEGRYEEAEMEYYTLTVNSALSTTEQKSRANFGLAICQYHLGKYQQAFQSFLTAASFSPSNSIIYNNAAVSAYRAGDMEHAIEYQLKALNLLPAVEYYYNLARMYEDDEQYDLAVDNYLAVAIAEQNLTEIDKIDPVRVKEKLARLAPNSQNPETNKMLIGYKLSNAAIEVLTVNENEMKLKPGDFIVKVDEQKTTKKILAEYDREKLDPYNLIKELLWTVYRDGKQIYKKSSDKISLSTAQGGNYEVKLNIVFDDGKEITSRKTVSIKENETPVISKPVQDEVVVRPPRPVRNVTRTYEYAVYEQLFESDFDISNKSYVDKHNVVWGKDNIDAQPVKQDTMDKLHSLVVINNSDNDAGIWANFDAFVKQQSIKGKPIRIGFYAKRESENTTIDVILRIKLKDRIMTIPFSYILKDTWEEKNINIVLPEETNGFTISINTKPGQMFRIDGFRIID